MALESTGIVFHFSTAHVPVKERLSSWNNFFGRSLSRRVLVPPPRAEGDFHIEMTARVLEARTPEASSTCPSPAAARPTERRHS